MYIEAFSFVSLNYTTFGIYLLGADYIEVSSPFKVSVYLAGAPPKIPPTRLNFRCLRLFLVLFVKLYCLIKQDKKQRGQASKNLGLQSREQIHTCIHSSKLISTFVHCTCILHIVCTEGGSSLVPRLIFPGFSYCKPGKSKPGNSRRE